MQELKNISPRFSDFQSVSPMYSMFSHEIYGFWCLACGCFWKIYQKSCHNLTCSTKITKLFRNKKYWVNRASKGPDTNYLRGVIATFTRMKDKKYAYMQYHRNHKNISFLAEITFDNNGFIKKLIGVK